MVEEIIFAILEGVAFGGAIGISFIAAYALLQNNKLFAKILEQRKQEAVAESRRTIGEMKELADLTGNDDALCFARDTADGGGLYRSADEMRDVIAEMFYDPVTAKMVKALGDHGRMGAIGSYTFTENGETRTIVYDKTGRLEYRPLKEKPYYELVEKVDIRDLDWAMISQPMKGRSEEDIVAERSDLVRRLTRAGYIVRNTYFPPRLAMKYLPGGGFSCRKETGEEYITTDGREWVQDSGASEKHTRAYRAMLWRLVRIAMSGCGAVVFCKGWEQSEGCRLERKMVEKFDGVEAVDESFFGEVANGNDGE